jgi:hypothetical protein
VGIAYLWEAAAREQAFVLEDASFKNASAVNDGHDNPTIDQSPVEAAMRTAPGTLTERCALSGVVVGKRHTRVGRANER